MSIIQKTFQFIFYNVMGWKADITVDIPDKCVVCVAPHTSNWDLFVCKFFDWAHSLSVSYMMKKEWFFFPLGPIFKATGGIPVYRGKSTSLTEQMAKRFAERTRFRLAITPEATRKANPYWKLGFYFIAQEAGVPVLPCILDYGKKTIRCSMILYPSGDVDKDMETLNEYFKDSTAKKPAQFALYKKQNKHITKKH